MWVKICGIRDEQTAEEVCLLQPDAIGLNFYSQSPRSVSRETAARIAKITLGRLQRVGVFVNHARTEIEDLVGECQLDAVQLHGDESAADIAEIATSLAGIPVFGAWRMAGETLSDLAAHLANCSNRNVTLAGCLIDSRVSGAYGGTGHTVPWTALVREYKQASWPPLILAGGLTPENVTTAIQTVRPWGVDVASGVESSAGVKSIERVRRFIECARGASEICPDIP